MPAITLFYRKWKVGSDDFVYPMIGENILRIAWFLSLLTTLILYKENLINCDKTYTIRSFYTLILIITGAIIFFNFVIMANSMRGAIFDFKKMRRLVPCMVTAKLLFFIPEIGLIGLGTYFTFGQNYPDCSQDSLLALKIIIGLCWLCLPLLITFILIIFDPLGNKKKPNKFFEAYSVWKRRCNVLCCCINKQDKDGEDSFNDISKLLAIYFYRTDLVMTDLLAGMFLINIEQRVRQKDKRLYLRPYTGPGIYRKNLIDAEFSEEWMNLTNAKHYMKFALASYGWMFFVYDNAFIGPGKLCCSSNICCTRTKSDVYGDVCFCNTSAILQQLKIQQKDIIYANFTNKLYEIPFYIAMDHKFKAIVVAIRGTLSFYDAVTDLTIENQDMEIEFEGDAKAHKGILQAATYIKNKIVECHLLDQAFTDYPNYRLVVTGHSLGAGAAALLSVLLRDQYKSLICFSFSPPGWLVSLPLRQYMQEFVCSVVIGKDLVPRLGLFTLNDLKNEMNQVVKNSKEPKYRILGRGFLRAFSCCTYKHESSEISDQSSDVRLFDNPQTSLDALSNHSNQDIPSTLDNPYPLYLPGKILYLEKDQVVKKCCSKTIVYKAYWAEKEFFDEILISPKMLSEHKPDVVYEALKTASEEEECLAQVVTH